MTDLTAAIPATPNPFSSIKTAFDSLSVESVTADQACDASRHQIRTVLAKQALFYRDTSQVPGALDQLYATEGLVATTGPEPDFSTFVKCVFRLDLPNPNAADQIRSLAPGSRRNKISSYVAVLQRLDAEITNRPLYFQNQPLPKLLAFIEDSGGISGMVKARAHANANANVPSTPIIGETEAEIITTRTWIAAQAIHYINRTTIIGSVMAPNPSALPLNADGYTTCICYQDPNGQINVLAASNDNELLAKAALHEAQKLSKLPDMPLRMLAEVAATQSFPSEFCPRGSRSQLTGPYRNWYESVYSESGQAPGGEKSYRRLVVRQGGLLLSCMQVDSSVITTLTPTTHFQLANDPDFYLDADDLRLVEEWLETDTIIARTAKLPTGLGTLIGGAAGEYAWDVTNQATGNKTPLRLCRAGRASDDPIASYQADLKLSGYAPKWTFTATLEWFHALRVDFLDDWFRLTAAGNKLKRRENWLFEINITQSNLCIGYEVDATGNYPTHDIALGSSGSSPATMSGSVTSFSVGAKDLAPVFYNLSGIEVDGTVKVSGDEALVLLEFRTDCGDYRIAIPTATAGQDGVTRSTAHMTDYRAP